MNTDFTLADAVAQLVTYTAEEIAELLTLAGKTGQQGDEHSCPMANYFCDVLGRETVVSNNITWYYLDDYEGLEIALPGGVKQFIRGFDEGYYPHLIEGDQVREDSDDE